MARLPIVAGLFFIALIHVTMSISVQEFFPEIKNNLTKIKWSHATNSKAKLEAALNSSEVMMIEADVTMGHKIFSNGSTSMEIGVVMAHPPNVKSDLTLSEFLSMVAFGKTNATKKKGIKLDFKTIEAFENGTTMLNLHNNIPMPVWVNADILKGPVNATSDPKPVDANRFMQAAAKLSMRPLLSIGWTTRYVAPIQNGTSDNYTREQINEMLKVVKEANNVNQPITYPVRACYAANDIELMKTLLAGTPAINNATLTIWSADGDEVDTNKLSLLIRTIGINKVFVDVPKNILEKLNFNSAFTAKSSVFVVFISMIVTLFSAKLL